MKPDEHRQRFLGIFRKTILTIEPGGVERTANTGEMIYLIRYSLITTRWFSVKIHKILMNDDDCMHDHPWSFISFILSGGYMEYTPTKTEYYSRGSILWRPQPWPHRLELIRTADWTNRVVTTHPATTLVITFKKVRTWGFFTPSGWRPWNEYIRSGRKCE